MQTTRAKSIIIFLSLGVAALLALALLVWHGLAQQDEDRTDAVASPVKTLNTASPERAVRKVSTALPEKEPYSPPRATAPELAALVDRNAKDRVTADITSKIPSVRHEEDMPAVVSVLLDTDDDDTARNEAANLLLRSDYGGMFEDLTGILANPDEKPRFRSFCVQKLWENAKQRPEDRGRTLTILHGLVKDKDAPVRREALLALVRMRDPKGEKTAVEWLAAENADGVRDTAIRCVRELDLREHTPVIREYLRDENDVVRIAAIVTLSQWGDEESREAIKEAAKSDSFRLRRCAELALKRLDRATKAAKKIRKRTAEPGDAKPGPGAEDRPPPAPPQPGEDEPDF